MSVRILDAMGREGFEELVALYDRRSRLRGMLAVHDTSLGAAFGGIRRRAYASENQALLDALRLARAMTHKCVLADLPAGGAKLVVMDRDDLDREGAYRHIGRFVERQGGRYCTGPDLGSGDEELAWVAAETRFATDPGPAGPGELAEATAGGVFAGIRAALEHQDGEADWQRRTVVVQGLGAVGSRLARRLVAVGARVVASDQVEARARELARELGIEVVEAGAECAVRADVFSPNAVGGVLHDVTLARLGARIVAGGANNVLATTAHGDRLHEQGVLFVPDILISSGAIIRGVLFQLRGVREPVVDIEARIHRRTAEILSQARDDGRPPARVALREAQRGLVRRRANREPAPAPLP